MKRIKVPAVIYGLIFFLLFAGVVLGSAYQMKTGEGNGVQDYLTNFFEQIKGGADSNAVFKNALKENFICLGMVFAAGFFRIGFVFSGAAVLRRGFVIGFTAAGFVRYFGAKGFLAVLAMLPGTILIIPGLLFFASLSSTYALKSEKTDKKYIITYILFMLITSAIFCISALAEGYLTTTFIKQLAITMI